MTVLQLFGILVARPFPGSADLRMSNGGCCFTVEGAEIGYYLHGWGAYGRVIPAEWPIPLDFISDAERVHAEIRRVLAVLAETSPSWEQIEADCVGPDLPEADPYIPTLAELAAEPPLEDVLYDRAAAEQALAKVTAERDDIDRRLAAIKSDRHEETLRWADEREALRAEVKRLTDAHAVVSQRLAGSQKEVAERDATIANLRSALESVAGHVGADPWAVEEIKIKVAELSQELDAAITRSTKARQQRDTDDELREQIAVAVGLDGSASLGMILDTVKSADTTKDADLTRLVRYHQAPIKFNARPLTLAERASFVIRRLWQGRTNAANEAAALRRELSDISDALGDLPDTAEREPIGDREEHLGLSTAERIRLIR